MVANVYNRCKQDILHSFIPCILQRTYNAADAESGGGWSVLCFDFVRQWKSLTAPGEFVYFVLNNFIKLLVSACVMFLSP